MQTRDYSLKVKALDDSGTFTGYASTYNSVDLVGDLIEPGAYRQSIASQGSGYPLLWAHKQDEPLGIARVSDSAEGLVVNGSLLLSDPAAKRAYEHLKNGSIKAMSIGYSLPYGEGKVSYSDDGTRTLKEVRLHEISLVAVPANPYAVVTTVKSLTQVEGLLRGVKPGDVDAVLMEQLRGIDAELKRLLMGDGNMQDDQAAEELAMLKSFAAELKSII